MTVTRAIAATAMLTGLAVGAAGTAWAAPTMSGHYIDTETAPSTGESTTSDWFVTPCGDGCASVAVGGVPFGQARLVNGQWTMDAIQTVACIEGNLVPNVYTSHYSWDPSTLAGTVQATYTVPACGRHQPGETVQNNLQLRQAPTSNPGQEH